MTAEHSSGEPRPRGAIGSERRFLKKREKYTGNEKPTLNASSRLKHEEVRKGYLSRKLERFREKIRANVEAGKRHAWSVVSANPFIDTRKRGYIYKVKNGELSVMNERGVIISKQKDVRLEKYNGVTLRSDGFSNNPNRLKGGIRTRIKLNNLEGVFGGLGDKIEQKRKRIRAIAKKVRREVLLSPIKVPFKLGIFGIRNGYRGTKLSIKYGYKGTKVAAKHGFKKGKVLANQYKEGEGIFSYRKEGLEKEEGGVSSLEVGQSRGINR